MKLLIIDLKYLDHFKLPFKLLFGVKLSTRIYYSFHKLLHFLVKNFLIGIILLNYSTNKNLETTNGQPNIDL